MIASMPVPVRRFAATAVLTAVAGAGVLAAAPVALADTPAATTTVVTAPAAPPATSPLPTDPVTVTVKGFSLVLQPVVVQVVQTVVADYLAQQGRLFTYDSKGLLVVGPKICNPAKSAAANKGCVDAGAPRI